MSRVSQESGLSPSISGGGINLGKDNGPDIDMGRKTEPSISSGGVGISQEITNIGGVK